MANSATNRPGGKNYQDKPGTHKILLEEDGDFIIVREHLYRTEDQRIVQENNLDGRWLAYPRGARITKEEAIRQGLMPEPKTKGRKPEENK